MKIIIKILFLLTSLRDQDEKLNNSLKGKEDYYINNMNDQL